MSRRVSVFTDFTGGEVSPRLTMRGDLPGYQKACKTVNNFIVRPQGGAYKRPGTRKQATAGQGYAVVPIRNGGATADWLILITASGLTIYSWAGAGFNLIKNVAHTWLWDLSSSTWDPAELQWTQNGHELVIYHPEWPPVYVRWRLIGDFGSGDVYDVTVEEQPPGLIPSTAIREDGTPGQQDGVWQVKWTNPSFGGVWTWYPVINGVTRTALGITYNATPATMEANIKNGIEGGPDFETGDVTVTNTGTDEYQIVLSGNNPDAILGFKILGGILNKWTEMTHVTAGTSTDEPAWSFPEYVEYDDGGGLRYYQCLQGHTADLATNAPVSGGNAWWWDWGAAKPDWYDWAYPGGNPWQDGLEYQIKNRGFPNAMCYYEGRLLAAGSPGFGFTIWGSRVGSSSDFLQGKNDADPYQFTLNARESASFSWMYAERGILIGSSTGDWLLAPGISSSNVLAEKQTGRASERIRPAVVGADLFYVGNGAKRIRRLLRDEITQSFDTADFALVAEHITERGIKKMDVSVVPETIIWLLLDDGQLACISYDQQLGMAAWQTVETQGEVQDFTVIRAAGFEAIVMVMKYGSDYTVETLEAVREQVMLDSYTVELNITDPKNVAVGAHLDGETVTILKRQSSADPWVAHGTDTVASGQVTVSGLQNYDVAVGLPYNAKLETLEYIGEGSAYAARRRWADLFVRLQDSCVPTIQGQAPTSPETRVTEDVEVNRLGYVEKGAVVIEQNAPYWTEILGAYGYLEAGHA